MGQTLLQALKAAAGRPGPSLVLPVGSPPQAFLRPVATTPGLLRPTDIECLTLWRNQHISAFLTSFTATVARTTAWLTDVVGPRDTKILFMVDDLAGNPVGYMGLDFIEWGRGYGEADAVVRGGPAPRGTMGSALRTLLAWAEGQLQLRELGVRVLSTNPALGFYSRLGFEEYRRVPLRAVTEPDMVRLVEDTTVPASNVWFVHMRWKGTC